MAYSMDFNQNGTILATAYKKHIQLWDNNGNKKGELKGHTSTIEYIKFSPTNENILLSISTDQHLKIWDISHNKLIHNINLKHSLLNATWSNDSSYICIGTKDNHIILLNTTTYEIIHKQSFDYMINQIAFSTNSKYLLLTTEKGTINFISIQDDFKEIHQLVVSSGHVYCIIYDKSNHFFITGNADSIVSMIDTSEIINVDSYIDLTSAIRKLQFDSEHHDVSISSDNEIHIVACDKYNRGGDKFHLKVKYESDTWIDDFAWYKSSVNQSFIEPLFDDDDDTIDEINVDLLENNLLVIAEQQRLTFHKFIQTKQRNKLF